MAANKLRAVARAAPAALKRVPVPQKARTTKEIVDAVGISPAEAVKPQNRSPELAKLMPENPVELNFKQPEGIWYRITRSRTGNLPVYRDYNNAGGVWTDIRRVEGNAHALREDLMNLLKLDKKQVWVKNNANVVRIKGDRAREVQEILEQHL